MLSGQNHIVTGLRSRLVIYTLLLSLCAMVPVWLFSLSAYNEIVESYQTVNSNVFSKPSAQATDSLNALKAMLTKTGGLYFLCLIIIFISGAYFVNRLVIKPVRKLTLAAGQMAEGQYDVDLPVKPRGELGELTESFRLMHHNHKTTMQRQELENIALNEMLMELQASEARSKGVFNSVQDGLLITNGLGDIKAVNPAFCEMTGYQENELLEKSVNILVPISYRSKHSKKIVDFSLDSGQNRRSNIEVEVQCKDGQHIPVEISLSQLTTNNKHYVIGVIHDLRQRKKAERALRYERDRAQSYLDTAEVAIISIDTQGLITLVNRKCCELLGYSEAELLGKDYFGLCPDRDVVEEMREAYYQHVTKNETFPKYFYINLTTRDGKTKIFEWHNNTMKDFEWNTSGIILAGTDMTEYRKSIDERRALRERLQQAQKMEAIGQLSSGIAHDFNNLLASMMGYTELLQDMLADSKDDSIKSYLGEIYGTGERARDLIEGLLKYSRDSSVNSTTIDGGLYIPGIIDEMLKMLDSIMPTGIEMTSSIRQDAYPVLIDSVDLQQLIVNLCINASEAMQKHGSLLINAANIDQYHGICISCNKSFTGDFLELSFTDTGAGIEPEALTRLFEPFYTTKVVGEVGKGAGMGLAVVHGLVHDAGGHILVESKPGVGSTFRVLLPAANRQPVAIEA